jgi:threonine dehydratase
MINLQDIYAANELIGDLVKRTPVTRSNFLSECCNGSVSLKLENQQITNSFKIRGALNKMLRLSYDEMKRGVVTASAGNHAQAVAISAERLDLYAKIVLPKNASKIKIARLKEHDVDLLLYGNFYDEAEQKAIDIANKAGLTYISPYNDNLVIAGQGTIGLEILEDLPSVDTIIVPVGGGGLISGISIAIKSLKPSVNVIGVQSEASPVMYESLKAGRIVKVDLSDSIADGLHGGIEEEALTFGIVRTNVDEVLLVREKTIKTAIYLLWKTERQVVEGAGAVAIAPLIETGAVFQGKTVVSVISGGNIAAKPFRNILGAEADELKYNAG